MIFKINIGGVFMKAVVKYGYEKGEVEVRDIPIPEIGDDDILLEVKSAGVCGSDIGFYNGLHKEIVNPPVVLGHEFAGIVSKVGKNVVDWKIGDRVVSDNTGKVCGKCYACGTSNYLACPERLGLGYGMDGGFTKYVKIYGETLKVFPQSLMRIPDEMSFEEASIMEPFCNAYRAVIQESTILPGDFGAVFGVGPLGLFSIQALRVAGASKIIAIGLSGDAERFELAKKLGATDIVVGDKENVLQKVKEITGGEDVALSVDCAGVSAVLKQALDITRMGGQIVKIGYDEKPLGFSLDIAINKGISIKGHFGYDWVSWRNSMNLVAAGKIDLKSMISHKMTLSEFKEAFDLVIKQKSIKIVLYPED
jgi:threonine dehydrogenase-like Zn-dependent dehydrogenase